MNIRYKLLLIMFGSLVVIMIGMISTESKFDNQHTWKDTASIDCSECHLNIWNEINSNSNMPHYQKNCTDCHQHVSMFSNGTAHAAIAKIECQACHWFNMSETTSIGGTSGFNYSINEAHWSLYNMSESNTLMGGTNEACVACHTNYDLSVTFIRPDYYEFGIDYGTGTLDGGLLNGTPDRLVVEGTADVTNFVNSDDVYWRDIDSDSDWDHGEDIFRDNGDGSYGVGDTVLYVGVDGQDASGSAVEFGIEQEIFYLDSDHDGNYDYTVGNEEPFIYVGSDGGSVANDADLKSTHEVLMPYSGISWVTDAVKFSTTKYYFFDNEHGIPGTFDANETIILDDSDNIIESGVLNGADSPDEVITAGDAHLSTFVSTDQVTFNDSDSDTIWDDGEDIVYDVDDDGTFDLWGGVFDYRLYIGPGWNLLHGDTLTDMSSNLKYLDSDHSGNYTLGEPIVNSSDLLLDSSDELLLREDDIYDNGVSVYGLWDFDINPFNAEFFIDNNNNGDYDNGEAIIRETYRIYDNTTSGIEESSMFINYSTNSAGLHVYRNGSQIWDVGTGESYCGDANIGCHQDVYNSIQDGSGGGHYTNSTLGGHNELSNCSDCHRTSEQIDPDNDHFDATTGSWHSAKRVTCAYEGGCHDSLFTGGLMEETFEEITSFNNSIQGDLCWSCHRGDFDWTDPTGETFRVYVEDEAADQQVMINSVTVYSPTDYNNCDCHDDTIASVPSVPVGSGKFVDHSTASADNYDQCIKCHKEFSDPHNDSHAIDIDWTVWENDNSAIPSSFCNTSCHYSVNQARPKYVDTNTTWMAIEYDNWILNGKRHTFATLLGGDGTTVGSVSCTEYCHTSHDTIPSCTDSGCHLDNDALANKRDLPDSHDSVVAGTIDVNRYPCARTVCHGDGAHDPQPSECHGSGVDGGCEPNSYAHPKHIESTFTYNFNCTECHYDSALGYNDGNGTYGGSLHINGIINVAFGTTIECNATYGGVLISGNLPTYQGSGGTCNNTYCHSNGYNVGGVGFETYTTPGWDNGTTTVCGDCHGISPNLATESHLKHTGSLFYNASATADTILDTDGNITSGIGVRQDVFEGYTLINFSLSDNVFIDDDDTSGDYSTNDDIWYDDNNNGVFDSGTDTIIFDSGDGIQDTNRFNASEDFRLKYYNISSLSWQGGEDIIFDWNNDSIYNSTAPNPSSMNYSYDCSECHYTISTDVAGLSTGLGTYNSIAHVNMSVEVNFDSTANGMSTRLGNSVGSYNPTTNACSNVYCHSNGVDASMGGSWGTAPFGTMTYSTPTWGTSISTCGSCHEADLLGQLSATTEYPNTGAHRRFQGAMGAVHIDNDQGLNDAIAPDWTDNYVQCFWCHAVDDTFDYQGTYGTNQHANADVLFNPFSVPNGGTMNSGHGYDRNSSNHCGGTGGGSRTCW